MNQHNMKRWVNNKYVKHHILFSPTFLFWTRLALKK